LFEIPGGWLGDRIGPRKVLMRIVLWWSFFTAATGWVWSYFSLLITRFLFGAGEAGCFPNLTKAFSAWLPSVERTRAQAMMWMGARWGGAFTPLLVVTVMTFVDWRKAFLIFALLGVVWTVVFVVSAGGLGWLLPRMWGTRAEGSGQRAEGRGKSEFPNQHEMRAAVRMVELLADGIEKVMTRMTERFAERLGIDGAAIAKGHERWSRAKEQKRVAAVRSGTARAP
jgi:MFS family permease